MHLEIQHGLAPGVLCEAARSVVPFRLGQLLGESVACEEAGEPVIIPSLGGQRIILLWKITGRAIEDGELTVEARISTGLLVVDLHFSGAMLNLLGRSSDWLHDRILSELQLGLERITTAQVGITAV